MSRLPWTGEESEYQLGVGGMPILGPRTDADGTSPYLDWFLERYYINVTAWKQ